MTEQDYLDIYASQGIYPNEAGIVPLRNLGFEPPVRPISTGGMNPWEMTHYAGPPVELADRGDYGRAMSNNEVLFDTTNQEGRNFLTATDRFHNRGNWDKSKVYPGFVPPGSVPPVDRYASSVGPVPPVTDTYAGSVGPVPPAQYTPGLISQPGPLDSSLLQSPSGYVNPNAVYDSHPQDYSLFSRGAPQGPTGAVGPLDSSALSSTDMYGGSESALATDATASATADSATGLSGPQMFAANMALNMIPTRDRKKVDTPFGGEGSPEGIIKGGGKGAMVGSTFGPKGALIGGLIGAGLATQGYFDSTTPPSIQVARVKRGGGGMPKGLLGGIYA